MVSLLTHISSGQNQHYHSQVPSTLTDCFMTLFQPLHAVQRNQYSLPTTMLHSMSLSVRYLSN